MPKPTAPQIRDALALAAYDLVALRTTDFNQVASKVLVSMTLLDKLIKKQPKGDKQ